MAFSSWIRNWKCSIERRWALYQTFRCKPIARRPATRPHLEALEARWLLSAYTVTSTGVGGAGSLRDAINQVNLGNYNEIDFKIGTVGSAQTINLATTPLPTLTANGVYINGLSQGGAGNTTQLITLYGPGMNDGLLLQGSNCTVSGLIIENFNNGIEVDGSTNTIGGTTTGAGNILSGNKTYGVLIDGAISGVQVQGNYIGTNTTGSAALANSIGVVVNGSNNTIGGTSSAARNIISGNNYDGMYISSNVSGVLVQGNYVGTDVTGNTVLSNGYIGVEIAGTNVIIGGSAPGAGNLISGNKYNAGIIADPSASGVQIQGNYIGTDVTGSKAIANGDGIDVEGTNITVGGTTTVARNIISGNTSLGVYINSIASGVQVQGNYVGTDVTGTKAVANSTGIDSAGSNNTIGGTATGAANLISGNKGDGVVIGSGVTVQGNYIGTNNAGAAAVANGIGVYVGGSNSTIGGTSAAARNIISGNGNDGVLIGSSASGVSLQGNYIGTDVTGTTALGNGYGVYVTGSNNIIGGTATGLGNIISGNSGDGVFIDASGVTVQGNYIGTDATGTKAVANSVGVRVVLSNDTIGGATTGAGNLISGNTNDGVYIYVATGVLLQGNSIGTDVTGTKAVANSVGIFTSGSSNTIGGTVTGAANLISGNTDGVFIAGASSVTVQGNFIGTDATGANALANTIGVYVNGSNNTIGGTASAARNVISGNSSDGVFINSSVSGVQIQGNYIGTNAAGSAALANTIGIEVVGSNNTIGGTTSGARNVISGNREFEVSIDSSASGVAVQGNYVGTDATGATGVGDGIGIRVYGSGNTIGAGNVISESSSSGSGYGVYIDSTGSGVAVQGNYIGTDATGTKSIGNDIGIYVFGSNATIGGAATGAGNIISGFSNTGVNISGATGVQVQGNYVGTDVTGTKALGNTTGLNSGKGIFVGGFNDTIGGTAAGARNIISGNINGGFGLLISTVSGVQVQGNYIGTDVSGGKALGNYTGIWAAGSNDTIGGTAAGAGNVISGNKVEGIYITGSGVAVQGNYVGTDSIGTRDIANSIGVDFAGSNNTIGGTSSAARNIISGNGTDVYIYSSVSGVVAQGNYIGTDVTGSTSVAIGSYGVDVEGPNNTIGGTVAGAGNVISFHSVDGVLVGSSASGVAVQGNYIGTDAAGANAAGNNNGIDVEGSNNTIGGTSAAARNVISNYVTNVLIGSGASGVVVQGNYVGINAAGTLAFGIGNDGIDVEGPNNTIGGTVTGARNVISGNSQDGVLIGSAASGVAVLGNYVGTNATGSKAIGNSIGIAVTDSNNTIGGTSAAARNIISGNTNDGVQISASGVTVQGNYIGTDVMGTTVVANSIGILVSASKNTLGGTVSGAGNLISGNSNDGVQIASGTSGVLVQGNRIGTNAAGTAAVGNYNGIEVTGTYNTVGGSYAVGPNVISGNGNDGVLIDSSISYVGDNQVLGNYIGTNYAGTAPVANKVGIEDAAVYNTIGGSVLGARNIISGNSTDGVLLDSTANSETIEGNYIGVNVGGNTALANSMNGVEIKGAGNLIGGNSGSNYFVRNYISGNGNDGVLIDSSAGSNQVRGNFIGVGVSGTNGVGNVANGVEIAGTYNTIGGTSSGCTNVISGNGNDGVLLDSTAKNIFISASYVGTDSTGQNALANSGSGIEVQGTGNTVGAGNILSGNSKDGVRIDSSASGNQVLGTYIGVNLSGAALANGGNGLNIAGNNNTIGGTASSARNILSGNSKDGVLIASSASGNQLLGNFLGANPLGTSAVANSIGIEIAGNNNTLGGSVSGSYNVISGNSGDGVLIDNGASGNAVLGNNIGVNSYDTAVLGNSGNGIEVAGNSNTLGALYSVAPNVISGNSGDGVLLDSTSSGNQVLGSYIGVNGGGTLAMGNKVGIEDAGSSNTIGGSVLASRNIISANSGDGVLIDATGTAETMQDNYIGISLSGNTALANSGNGVEIKGNGNLIGGNSGSNYYFRNFISGNSKDGVLIDSGASGNQVQGNFLGLGLNGAARVSNLNGIEIASSSNTVGGASFGLGNYSSGNSNDGVLVDSTGANNLLEDNFVGTDSTGRNALANSVNGVDIQGTGNTLGGVNYARNLISGNGGDGVLIGSAASGNLVQGNNIGSNIYDTAALGNSGNGIEVAGTNNTIGASYAVAPNEMSGNSKDGVLLDSTSSGNQVLGNYIGTNHSGLAAVANQVGIEDGGSSNTIGGSVLGARNLISGNTGDGVLLDSTATAETMEGNYIGVNVGGSVALANSGNGVEIKGNNNIIGGNSGTNYYFRNFISGNSNDGVLIAGGASGNQVQGNFIGIGVAGTNGVGNLTNGVEIAGSSNTIGGTTRGMGNAVSGNSNDGVLIDSIGASNLLQANFVGTDYTGRNPLGNSGNGVEIAGSNNVVGGSASGAGNIISANSKNGVLVSAGSGDTISQNSIFGNTGLGISLASGANNNIVAPTLSSATLSGSTLTVTGSFTAAAANVPYVLEFFASPSGDAEGKIYLDSLTVTPTSTGLQTFSFVTTTSVTGTNPLITATLTDNTRDTSEFSSGITVL